MDDDDVGRLPRWGRDDANTDYPRAIPYTMETTSLVDLVPKPTVGPMATDLAGGSGDGDNDDDDAGQVVRFPLSNFDGTSRASDRVFQTWPGMATRPFRWTAAADVHLMTLSLLGVTGNGSSRDDFRTLRGVDFGSDGGAASAGPSDLFSGLTRMGVRLDLDAFESPMSPSSSSSSDLRYGDVLALQVEWELGDERGGGRSVSGYFAVADADAGEAEVRRLQDRVMGYDLAEGGFEVDDGDDVRGPGATTSGGAGAGGASPSATGLDAGGKGIGDGGAAGGGGGGGGKGLSSGALAGIVVGGVAFACLVAGLAWFLLRRRRRRGPRAYDNDDDDTSIPAAKTGPPDVQDSPTSFAAADDDDSRAAPAWTGPADAQGRRSSQAPTAAAPPSPGAPRGYSHLMEEGMTEQDIRRLEDEERQLDAEIERSRNR